jgi:hypothetical protein
MSTVHQMQPTFERLFELNVDKKSDLGNLGGQITPAIIKTADQGLLSK